MQKLIFIYNANSGLANTFLDVAHKIFSPKTYNCNLCAITFDTFSENKVWKDFREQSNIDMEFLHIDEFETKHTNTNYTYPIIIKETQNGFEEFMSTKKINTLNSIEALISIIKTTL
ncbi:GTPase [uncultured Lacinutrix sp.]|uniref:GTPase n=1 Tax=uncultured Lacinutrix sp. TaxID=574032 RepID=UPI002635DF94|nr:GTPase [uncultured Lacinutrix sp.]